jgi:hypothetical protein
MPAARPPVREADIAFIEKWINDGCLDDDIVEMHIFARHEDSETLAREDEGLGQFVTFFRNFDYFFTDRSNAEVQAAITQFFDIGYKWWPGWDLALEVSSWVEQISLPESKASIARLSADQLRIMRDFFGAQVTASNLNNAFWHFGCGTLPPDDLRPQDRKHQMNGYNMWMYWLAFADACMRTDTERAAWEDVGRAVALGMVGDALFRTDRNVRLRMVRYRADTPNLEEKVIGDLKPLAGEQLLSHLTGLGREAWGADAIA